MYILSYVVGYLLFVAAQYIVLFYLVSIDNKRKRYKFGKVDGEFCFIFSFIPFVAIIIIVFSLCIEPILKYVNGFLNNIFFGEEK